MTEACIDHPSPNCGPRPAGCRIDMLILHYTGMRSAREALERLCDPAARVSCHYLIDEDGSLYRLAPETARAWHAGLAEWEGKRDINSRSIGIELVNPGHEFGYRPFPDAQIDRLIRLCGELTRRHAIPPWHVLGHADVAPGRKADPGELFPWARLADAGIGLWPAPAQTMDAAGGGAPAASVTELQSLFHKFGYMQPGAGPYPVELCDVALAFQRHWRPQRCDGVTDRQTLAILRALTDAKAQGQGTPTA